MRIPEKTILGIGATLLTLSALQSLWHVLDGHALARMQSMAGHMSAPESFRIGFIGGLTVMLALKLFAGIGTWIVLARRWRAS